MRGLKVFYGKESVVGLFFGCNKYFMGKKVWCIFCSSKYFMGKQTFLFNV